jgi:hypothetical protein
MAATITGTARANVVTGEVAVTVPGATDVDFHHEPDGTFLFLQADVAPWGEDEQGMDRADRALARMGWRRTGDWVGSETLSCPVAAP